MAYDGFYSGLSTRATVNEILNLAIETKDEILEAAQGVQDSADAAQNSADAAAISETNAASSASDAMTQAGLAAGSAGLAEGFANDASASAAAAAVSAQSAQDALDDIEDIVAGGIVEEAPIDGQQYARKDAGWVVVTGGGGGPSNDVFSATISSGVLDLSAVVEDTTAVTLTENITSILLPAGIVGKRVDMIIRFVQDGTGGRSVNGWPSVTWEGGSQPAVNSAASSITLMVLTNVGNSGWYGTVDLQGNSLANFTDLVNTTAPNAAIPVVALLANHSNTNVDVAIVAKGNGALLAQIPNNAASGGNKRGSNAVDWQLSRSSASQVASGNNSVICGGQSNTVGNTFSFVGGGSSNNTQSSNTFIGGGSSNTISSATASFGIIVGGSGNSLGGDIHEIVLGGLSNVANGGHSIVLGGSQGTTRSIFGVEVRSSGGFFGVVGSAQRGRYIMRTGTVNATPTRVTTNDSAPSTNNQAIMPNESSYCFTGRVVGKVVGNQVTSSWEFKGTIRRGANAASTTMVAAVTPTVISQDAAASTWSVSVVADTTNGGIAVNVTGAAATTINWVCDLETVEVVG